MKLTKTKLKQLIKEELDNIQKEDLDESLFDIFGKKDKSIKYEPSRSDYSHEEWEAEQTHGKLKDEDQKVLDTSYDLINGFLQQTQAEAKTNIERYKAMQQLLRDLSSVMIYKTPKDSLRRK